MPERQDLLLQEGHHAVLGQERRRRLEEEGLVGRAAALGDEEEFVGVLALGIDLDLRRQVGSRVALLEHRERRELRIAQVALEVGVADALGDGALVIAVGPDRAALLAHDDRRAGVLAHGQDAAGGDIGVLQQVVGDELVVRGRLRIVEDGAQLPQMSGPQQVVDVDEGLLGKKPDRLALDDHDLAPAEAFDPDALVRELPIGRRRRRRAGRVRDRRKPERRTSRAPGNGRRLRGDDESTPSSASVAAASTDAEGAQAARGVGDLGQDGVEGGRVAGRADPVEHARLAQHPRDAGERLEMVGAGAFRREQKENDVDGLAVEGLEIDRLLEAGDKPEQTVEIRPACRAEWRCPRRCRSSRGARAAAAPRRSPARCEPVSCAAWALSSCRACFLPLTRRDRHDGLGTQEIKQTPSIKAILVGEADKDRAVVLASLGPDKPRRLYDAFARRRIDPADRRRRGGGIRRSRDRCQHGRNTRTGAPVRSSSTTASLNRQTHAAAWSFRR